MTQSFASLYAGLDLAGTIAFALSGTLASIERELDPFGVSVLAIATALGGGVLRDILIGAVPPAGIQNWGYLIGILAAIVMGYFLVSADQAMVSCRVGFRRRPLEHCFGRRNPEGAQLRAESGYGRAARGTVGSRGRSPARHAY